MTGPVTPQAIIERASALSGVAVEDILGPSRARHIVAVRWAAMVVIRELTEWSQYAIADLFSLHRTSVLHALAMTAADPESTAARLATAIRRDLLLLATDPGRDG